MSIALAVKIFFYESVLLLLLLELHEELLRLAGDNAAKQNQRHEVREGHEPVEDVGARPHGAHREVGPDEHRGHVNPAVGEDGIFLAAPDEVFQAALGVVSPPEDGGEREEHECHGKDVRGDVCAGGQVRKPAGERFHGDVHALQAEFRIPCACHHDGKARHGADDDGVDEGARHAHETLANRFLGLGSGGSDRGRAEARLVTEDTAGDTLLHGDKDGAHHAAGDCARVECRADYGLDGGRDVREVEAQNEQAEDDVEDGHERHDVERDLRDALEPADDDAGCERRAEQARDGRGVRDRVAGDVDEFTGWDDRCDRRGNAVHLRDGADAEQAREHAEHGEQYGEPLEVEPETFLDTCFDVVEGAAQNLAVVVDLAVLDREQAFGVLGGHAEEGGDFHPEERARAAGTDGGRDTHDVTRADGGRKSRAERREARDFAFAFLFAVEHVAQRVAEVCHLQDAETAREQDAYEEDDADEGYAPHVTVDGIEKCV